MINGHINIYCFSIYPSSHDNSIQIPIGNNTGSLPDLTSVHFPSPLHTPIDQEHDHSSSPYSSVSIFFVYLFRHLSIVCIRNNKANWILSDHNFWVNCDMVVCSGVWLNWQTFIEMTSINVWFNVLKIKKILFCFL